MLNFFKKIPWQDLLLVVGLILFDMSIHPLTTGPDRLIHDPAVYRLGDPNYMPGDWYTDMAVKSNVYIFYAKLVNAWRFFHVPEEFWRLLLYVASLGILYYALIRIARLFSKNILVVPLLVLLHLFLSTGYNQPVWLYGPFIQIDGGVAPRSIGVALSFLALFFLMNSSHSSLTGGSKGKIGAKGVNSRREIAKATLRSDERLAGQFTPGGRNWSYAMSSISGSLTMSALLLGLATLVHVSNSFIVFTLFLLVWLVKTAVENRSTLRQKWLEIIKKAGLAIGVYLLAGGWFAFYVASSGSSGTTEFTTDKFIWSWIYLRAPYMALPLAGKYWWIRLSAHIASIIIGWLILRKKVEAHNRQAIDILALIGLGSVVYFFLFYLFAFVWPWLPGFQFYSIRVVYLAHFVAYLFISLVFLMVVRDLATKLFKKLGRKATLLAYATDILAIAALAFILYSVVGKVVHQPKSHNLRASWWRVKDTVSKNPSKPPQYATFQYIYANPQPFLAPPNWKTGQYYLPNIASFKSFGFTKEGLPEWYRRIDDASGGEVERIYKAQLQAGRPAPIYLEWDKLYPKLTEDQVLTLSTKYNFQLFLTYRNLSYPFPIIAEDDDFRLYKLPETKPSPQR